QVDPCRVADPYHRLASSRVSSAATSESVNPPPTSNRAPLARISSYSRPSLQEAIAPGRAASTFTSTNPPPPPVSTAAASSPVIFLNQYRSVLSPIPRPRQNRA